ncbi:hypothetical protein RhiirA4_455339 [Rhizophagus irregularis]|uniref:Uncharacterized protein n=1 Tax=Rhizophagus irregularis TaxID=588596 RepID=A0A2I1G4Y7_9GLOM|nr:hypothetical protein RhiirA4_455339 [Rhizophagus irregularis]
MSRQLFSSVHTTTSRYEPNKDINQVNRYQLQDKENHKNTIAGSMLQYEQLIVIGRVLT